jgi:hypothetical protein
MLVLWCCILTFLLWAPFAHAITYYVGKTGHDTNNTCTEAQNINTPKLTIIAGILCMQNAGGDSVLIRAGTYNQSIDTPIKSGSSHTNRNTIAAYAGEVVIVTSTAGSCLLCLRYPSTTNTYKYLIFDGIIFDGAGGTGGGLYQKHIDDGTIGWNIYRNGEIRNTTKSDCISGMNQFDEYHHMKIHHCGLQNLTDHQTHGVYACAHDVLVHDNEFYNNAAYGIQFYTSGAGNTGCSSRSKFYNNKFYLNSAILFADNPLSHTAAGLAICCGDSVEVYNNLFYSNGRLPGTPQARGLDFLNTAGPGTNYKVYNNTFYNNNGSGISILSGVPHIEIKNNIFWQNAGTPIDDRSGNSTVDSTNITTDPHFTNTASTPPNLLPLAPSNAIDTGVAYGGLTFDIVGTVRPSGGGIDKGAYEVSQGGNPGPGLGTFYVAQTGGLDSRTCTQAQSAATPRQTIASGLACLTTSGSTLLIKTGVYVENIDMADVTIPGGSDYAHATIIAASGTDIVTLKAPSGAPVIFMRDTVNSHYFIFDRLILDGDHQVNSNGFVCYPGSHHIRFQNGEIKNTWYEPVYIRDATGCEVVNTLIHDWHNLYGIHALGAMSGTLISRNTLYNGTGGGIKVDGNEQAGSASGIVLEKNIISAVGIGSSQPGIFAGGASASTMLIKNNVVYNSYRGIEIVTGSPTVKVLNNTVYGSSTQGIQINSGANSTQVKNNISYSNVATAILNNGTSTVQTTNLITDPSFTNAVTGDFTLQAGSAAINTGTNVSPDVVDDANGSTRSLGPYDIGAYEFFPSGGGSGTDVYGLTRFGAAPQSRGFFLTR